VGGGFLFPLILKNSWRNRRRTVLTILSIGASLCILGILMVFYYVFYVAEATGDQALRLVVRNRVSLANPMPVSYRQQIAQIPGVQEVTVLQWFGGTYKDSRDPANFFARFAAEPDRLFTIYPEYRLPDEQKKAFRQERQACILGRKIADRHGLKLGDRITLVGDIFSVKLELVLRGIYESERDNENLFFHFDYLNESLGGRGLKDTAFTFVVRCRTLEDVPRVGKVIDDTFRNSTQQTKTETEKAFEVSFLSFLGNVKAFLMAISAAVTFTILFVSANTMAMSVRERIREVGILKTVGFTPGRILGIIVGESIVVALMGGILGVLLAAGLCYLIRQGPSTFADVNRFRLQPVVIAGCMLSAVFIGLVSSLWPALSASRKSIVEALRYND